MNEGKEAYQGEVLFIVHAPEEILWGERSRIWGQARAKVKRATIIAGKKGIPIIYWPAFNKKGEDTLQNILKEVKKKPRVIEIKQVETLDFKPKQVLNALKQNKIQPTHATFMGQLRDFCVLEAATAARYAMPKTPISVIEGKGSVLLEGKLMRRIYKEKFALHGIARTKKLKFGAVKLRKRK